MQGAQGVLAVLAVVLAVPLGWNRRNTPSQEMPLSEETRTVTGGKAFQGSTCPQKTTWRRAGESRDEEGGVEEGL